MQLEQRLERVNVTLESLQKDGTILSKRLHEEKDKVASLKKPVDGASTTQEQLSSYDDALKYITELEEDALKNRMEIQRNDEIKSDLMNSIQEKKKELGELPGQFNSQKRRIAALKIKLEEIH